MIKIPRHVIPADDPNKFIPEEECRALKSAGVGYSIFKALGARKGLSPSSLKTIQDWCKRHCDQYPDVVPNERKLKTASLDERLFRPGKSALENAVRYPGSLGKPSYQELYQMVWDEQRWPELCRALSNNI